MMRNMFIERLKMVSPIEEQERTTFALVLARRVISNKGRWEMLIRISVCVAFAAMLSGCGSSADPTSPTSPVGCITTITIGVFSNGAPASPGQGLVWTSYFQATVLPALPSVYVVDINSAPAGCLTTWTAVSDNTSAVQLSPANGTGSSQVELFVPANSGAQRSTFVTIAGQTASITQAGR
jgi:hypothetical protein